MDSFQIEEYWVHPAHNKMELNGNTFKVEPKIMEVLCFLVKHQGQVVSRETIAKSLWSDNVIGLEVITRAIFELRKILNDSAKHPKFIETIARKGYCFIYKTAQSQVTKINSQQESMPSPHRLNTKQFSENLNLRLIIPTLAFVIIIISLFLTYIFTEDNRYKVNTFNYRASQLTHSDTFSEMPALSPSKDKILFVYSSSSNEVFNTVAMMDLKTNKKTIISKEDAHFRFPMWGLRNQYYYYLKCIEQGCQLIKHEILSGKQKVLLKENKKVYSYDISSSGNQIVVAFQSGQRIDLSLTQLGQNEVFPIIDSSDSKTMPVFNNDGSSIFYVAKESDGSTKIKNYNINKKSVQLVSSAFYSIISLTVASPNELLISGKKDGQFAIWLMKINSGELTKVTDNLTGEFQSQISISSDKSKIVYKNWQRNRVIGSVGLTSKPSSLNSKRIDFDAIYSAKNQTFYSVSNRSGAYEIWQHKKTISQQITQLKANSLGRPLLSPDNKYLAFLNKNNSDNQLIILDLATQQIYGSFTLPSNAHILYWSQIKDSIYFSVRNQGQYTLSKLTLTTNKLTKLVINAGIFVDESPSGNELTYVDMLNGHLMRQNSLNETESIVNLLDLNAAPIPRSMMLTNVWLYYITRSAQGPRLMRYHLLQNEVELYAQLPSDSVVTQIGGKEEPYVIFDLLDQDESQIILLEASNNNLK